MKISTLNLTAIIAAYTDKQSGATDLIRECVQEWRKDVKASNVVTPSGIVELVKATLVFDSKNHMEGKLKTLLQQVAICELYNVKPEGGTLDGFLMDMTNYQASTIKLGAAIKAAKEITDSDYATLRSALLVRGDRVKPATTHAPTVGDNATSDASATGPGGAELTALKAKLALLELMTISKAEIIAAVQAAFVAAPVKAKRSELLALAESAIHAVFDGAHKPQPPAQKSVGALIAGMGKPVIKT